MSKCSESTVCSTFQIPGDPVPKPDTENHATCAARQRRPLWTPWIAWIPCYYTSLAKTLTKSCQWGWLKPFLCGNIQGELQKRNLVSWRNQWCCRVWNDLKKSCVVIRGKSSEMFSSFKAFGNTLKSANYCPNHFDTAVHSSLSEQDPRDRGGRGRTLSSETWRNPSWRKVKLRGQGISDSCCFSNHIGRHKMDERCEAKTSWLQESQYSTIVWERRAYKRRPFGPPPWLFALTLLNIRSRSPFDRLFSQETFDNKRICDTLSTLRAASTRFLFGRHVNGKGHIGFQQVNMLDAKPGSSSASSCAWLRLHERMPKWLITPQLLRVQPSQKLIRYHRLHQCTAKCWKPKSSRSTVLETRMIQMPHNAPGSY